jgi:uncharacterized protein (DUF2126 family)
MWLNATLQNRLGRASRMARAGMGENAELETRVAKHCWGVMGPQPRIGGRGRFLARRNACRGVSVG